ncbi:hypothetical protein TSTA_028900, partial [Talaromyces stipitatus ATCC 10500]
VLRGSFPLGPNKEVFDAETIYGPIWIYWVPGYTNILAMKKQTRPLKKIFRRAARLFDVSEATLRRRLKGATPHHLAGIERHKMARTGEESLRSWACMLGSLADILLAERDLNAAPKK